MRYFLINLEYNFNYNFSGRSINVKPMKHLSRTLKDYELFFVTNGKLYIKQGQEYCVEKGEILINKKGEHHEGSKYSENEFYWVHFDGEVIVSEDYEYVKSFASENKKWIFFAEKFALKEPSRVSVMISLLNHYTFEKGNVIVKNYLAKALLSEIANQYGEVVSSISSEKRMDEILAFIMLNVNKELSVSYLAEKFSYNPKYLSLLFKKHVGMTAHAYIMDKKIDYAKYLLVSTTESVKTIAKETGFNDEYYFMRAFKKIVGITPKNYRKTYSGCNYS